MDFYIFMGFCGVVKDRGMICEEDTAQNLNLGLGM